MHWLSYLAHKLFGLSAWAWRLPFFVLYFVGAVMMFGHVARRSGTWFAFQTCTALAIFPLTIVYERTASNDTLMTALLVVSYVVAFGKGSWRIPVSSLIVSFLILVKPAVWALLPVTLSGVLSERKTRSACLDAALFVVLSVAFAFGWKAIAAATVSGEAAQLGMSSWTVLKKLCANYGLPDFFNFANDFKAFAAFPRDPSYQLLGPIAVILAAFPLAFLVRQVLRRKWNAHLLLYASVPAYVGAVSVMNTLYTHYYLPMIGLLPILLSALREDLAEEEGADEALPIKPILVDAILFLTVCGVGLLFLSSFSEVPAALQNVYSRIYNLPADNPWSMTGGFLAVGMVLGLVVLLIRRGVKDVWKDGLAAGVGMFAALSVSLAAYPAVHLAPYLRLESMRFLAPMALNLIAGGVLLLVFFVHPRLARKRWTIGALLPAFVVLTYVATPTWRSAAVEILRPATHVHAEVARELQKLVPEGSVVIGERTDQAFLSLPIRTAATFISNSDPTLVIEALWKRDPSLKLFAFADSQHAYNLQHYQKHQKEFQLQLVKTFKMPSFATGKPADVHLCRIIDRRPKAK